MDKPANLSREYGAQFQDKSMAKHYRKRPPYADELFDFLTRLVPENARLLDVGCGTGEIAIPLAQRGMTVTAIDASQAMLDIASQSETKVRWINATVEDFEFTNPFDLITCANSLHWLDWHTVMPKFSKLLSHNGLMAVIHGGDLKGLKNESKIIELISQFSTNQDYQPFNLFDELIERGLFKPVGFHQTKPIHITQPLDDYIASFHSRNGFSIERMGEASAEEFDQKLAQLLDAELVDGHIDGLSQVKIMWGYPLASF